jgi:hypothetical protein
LLGVGTCPILSHSSQYDGPPALERTQDRLARPDQPVGYAHLRSVDVKVEVMPKLGAHAAVKV